jgi:6-phosphogluconate dehydrogenase
MKIGIIGLGKMGSKMVLRLINDGHECVIYDSNQSAIDVLLEKGAIGSTSTSDLVSKLSAPRVIWLMIPSVHVSESIHLLATLLSAEDILIDGGNSYYQDDIHRNKILKSFNIHFVDVGTSGGILGLAGGYCLMVGGEKEIVQYIEPILISLSPNKERTQSTSSKSDIEETAKYGYLYCGTHGAGHFVKMIHNGIEYGIMGAYAEGLNILRNANIGKEQTDGDIAATELRNPDYYQYDLDLAKITELWRHSSIISSLLLDLTANALIDDPHLDKYSGYVADSGEGRWTINAALDEAVPAPILSAALYDRFSSRGNANFAQKILSAMRQQFGGHTETPIKKADDDS